MSSSFLDTSTRGTDVGTPFLTISGLSDVRNIARGLSMFSGDLRSTREVLERIRDQVAIPSTWSAFFPGNNRGWQDISDYTFLTRKHQSAPILVQDGTLMNAATAKTRWTIDGQAGDMFVEAGTFSGSRAPYGQFQHEGGPNPLSHLGFRDIPPRPFYNFLPEDVAKAELVIDQWIGENLNKRIGLKAAGTTVASFTDRA